MVLKKAMKQHNCLIDFKEQFQRKNHKFVNFFKEFEATQSLHSSQRMVLQKKRKIAIFLDGLKATKSIHGYFLLKLKVGVARGGLFFWIATTF